MNTKIEKFNFGNLTDYEKVLIKGIIKNHPDDVLIRELVWRFCEERNAATDLEQTISTVDPDLTIRRCDHCGIPMEEGYVLGDFEHACCESHALKLYDCETEEEAQKLFEEDLKDADTPEGDTYYTEWENYVY